MLQQIIAQLLFFIVRFINFTYRYEWVNLSNREKAIQQHPQGSYIYACWHQNLIGTIFSHIGQKYTMIVSDSKDGELVAITCKKLGHSPVRGSSTRGGKKAMIEIIKKLKSGLPGAISVDGPKGPALVVKPGIVEIARLADCPIIPISAYPVQYWSFKKSWDQFRLPKPFTKIYLVIAEPIYVSKEITKDNFDKICLEIAIALIKGEEIAKAKIIIR